MLLFEYFGLIFHNKVMGYINMGNWVESMVDWINNIAKVHIMQLDHIRFAKSPFYF